MIEVKGVVVKVGQVWEDCDPRVKRTLEIVEIDVSSPEGGARVRVRSSRGAMSWIKASRLKPGSKGYKLVKDAETPPAPVV